MSEALAGALASARSRLADGLVEAEAELARARARTKELQRTLALARAEQGTMPTAPDPIAIPDLEVSAGDPSPEETPVAPRQPERPAAEETPVAPRQPEAARTASAPTSSDVIPRRWRLALGVIARGDAARLPEIVAPNVIVRWEGDNPLAGTHLGDDAALGVLTRLARHVEPGSIVTEDLRETDGNVEVLVQLTFVGDIPDHVRLDTRVHAILRFDDAGRLALLFATPEEVDVVDGFLILAEEGEPEA